MTSILERLRSIWSFVRWIFQVDSLPRLPVKNAPGPLPPAKIEPPLRPRASYTRLPFIGWLIASEDLPEAGEMAPTPQKTSFLSDVFAAENLPSIPEPPTTPPGGAFLAQLFSRDHLPSPPESDPSPGAGDFLSTLFSRDRLPPPTQATGPGTDSVLNQSKTEIEGDRHGTR